MINVKDVKSGDVFERLTVLETVKIKGKGTCFRCKCSCGNIVTPVAYHVVRGNSKSCGCLRKELVTEKNYTHRMSRSKEYKIWVNLKNRCNDPKDRFYDTYGGRGITVCDEWLMFDNFYKDMGPRPSPTHSIDRIDNDKGYCKDNCRWATVLEQANNKSVCVYVEYQNRTQTLMEWCRELNLNYGAIFYRYYQGSRGDELFCKYKFKNRLKEVSNEKVAPFKEKVRSKNENANNKES